MYVNIAIMYYILCDLENNLLTIHLFSEFRLGQSGPSIP